MIKVKRALLSVSDKTGLIDFARGLKALGVELISTGGTAKALTAAGIPVLEVAAYTGFPEILDGRVKTLHPKIHGGLLALRENPEHLKQLEEHRIALIDMVVINLYPFERVTQKKNVGLEEAIENIDVGGPSMLRAAAKNYKNVAVVCNPERYKDILKELNNNSGILSDSVLINLALEAFQLTSQYDGMIYHFLNNRLKRVDFANLPHEISLHYVKVQDLRYGENPHQQGAFYRDRNASYGLAKIRQLHGKELSFNNLLDLNAAGELIRDFQEPSAVVVKHNNPTGVAVAGVLSKAFKQAFETDPLSAFGGIVGLNRPVDLETAKAIVKSGFIECVMAPAFDRPALALLSEKKNVRLLEYPLKEEWPAGYDFKRVNGGLLMQDSDTKAITAAECQVVSQRRPAKTEWSALLFAWTVVKNVKSNAVVLAAGTRTVGIGCGQTSRVDSVAHALRKAGSRARGAVLASEAFIPKVDNILLAKKAGIKAIIQTGGSIADPEVIAAANKAKIAMVFSGVRHFKH